MQDEFDGIGGSYLVDLKTGKRSLVERTLEPQSPAKLVEADATPSEE